MIGRLTYAALAMSALGCGLDTPAQPTWADDVKPILAANCVRCHTYPATGGAPDSFRLDMYDDFVAPDGTTIRGAGAMAQFIAIRVDSQAARDRGFDPMPPTFPITDRQVEILNAWFLQIGDSRLPERGGAPAGNRAPTMTLTQPLDSSLVDGRLVIQYEIRDPDRELVTGEVRTGPSFDAGVRIGAVHAGRGALIWDVATEDPGSYPLWARLDDGGATHDIELATYEHTLQDGNRAPRIEVTAPIRYDIVAEARGTYDIVVELTDPDLTDILTLTVDAVREGNPEPIATDLPALRGTNTIAWDTTLPAFADKGIWTLRVTASDGRWSRTTELPVRLSDTPETVSWTNVAPIFEAQCAYCHPGSLVPGEELIRGLTHNFADEADARRLRGLIYRRVVELENMPPPSYRLLVDEFITDAEREMLAAWLLAGAP